MGTWSTAIFSDDVAADVRDTFRDLIGEGLSAAEAVDRMLKESPEVPDDDDDGPVFLDSTCSYPVETRSARRTNEVESAFSYRQRHQLAWLGTFRG